MSNSEDWAVEGRERMDNALIKLVNGCSSNRYQASRMRNRLLVLASKATTMYEREEQPEPALNRTLKRFHLSEEVRRKIAAGFIIEVGEYNKLQESKIIAVLERWLAELRELKSSTQL